MMDWGNDGSGWSAWQIMTVCMVAFWGIVAWVVVTIVRRPSDTQRWDQSVEDVLAERFARGEIDAAEYAERRDALRSMP